MVWCSSFISTMQDIDDECTTVIKIHRNFDEKFRDIKRPRLGDTQGDKLTEPKWLKHRLGIQHNESEVISLKANISQLEMVIKGLEKQLVEDKIFHRKQMDTLTCDYETLKKQADEMKHQGLKVLSKYETAKEEVSQLKVDLQKCREENIKQNKTASLLAVQMELEEVKQVSSQKMKSIENEIECLKNTVSGLSNENDDLRLQLKSKSNELRKLELNYENAKHHLSTLNQQLKDLEHEKSKNEQNLNQANWVQSKMERCEQLEEENKQLKYEVSYLKSTRENVELLNEKCRSLQEKLDRSEKRCSELDDLRLGNEILRKRMDEFEPLFKSMPTLKCASDVVQLIESLNHTNQVYAEANGSLKTSLHKTEDELVATQAEIQRMRVEFTDSSSKCELMSSQFKSLRQKLLLVVKERDSYKNILDSYESEMTQTLDSTAQKKFKILEETSDGFKKQCLEKDGEIQKLSELIQNLKRKIVALEEQLTEQKHRFARSSIVNSDSGVILSLQ